MEKLNAKVKHLAKELKIRRLKIRKLKIKTIDHDENIDETCLSFNKLHLYKKGNFVLARNFLNLINKFRRRCGDGEITGENQSKNMVTEENISSNNQCFCTESMTEDEGPLDCYN